MPPNRFESGAELKDHTVTGTHVKRPNFTHGYTTMRTCHLGFQNVARAAGAVRNSQEIARFELISSHRWGPPLIVIAKGDTSWGKKESGSASEDFALC